MRPVVCRDPSFSMVRPLLPPLSVRKRIFFMFHWLPLCTQPVPFSLRQMLGGLFQTHSSQTHEHQFSACCDYPPWECWVSSHALVTLVTRIISRPVIHKLTKQLCLVFMGMSQRNTTAGCVFNKSLKRCGTTPVCHRLNEHRYTQCINHADFHKNQRLWFSIISVPWHFKQR